MLRFSENSEASRPSLQAPYWRNICYAIFYTQEIVISSHGDPTAQHQCGENGYTSISPLLTRITQEQETPLSKIP